MTNLEVQNGNARLAAILHFLGFYQKGMLKRHKYLNISKYHSYVTNISGRKKRYKRNIKILASF